MEQVEVGIRIHPGEGIAFFGLEEVNQRLAGGGRIVELKPGSAVMTKIDEDDDDVRMHLAGCQLVVVFA